MMSSMRRTIELIAACICVVWLVFGFGWLVSRADGQTRLQWQMRACGTLDCVTALLNELPADRAVEAKVTTINSQRSFLGVLSDPYYVWFRQ